MKRNDLVRTGYAFFIGVLSAYATLVLWQAFVLCLSITFGVQVAAYFLGEED